MAVATDGPGLSTEPENEVIAQALGKRKRSETNDPPATSTATQNEPEAKPSTMQAFGDLLVDLLEVMRRYCDYPS